MPLPYYGPLQQNQNRRQLGQQYRRARAAMGAARAAHNYARDNNLYQRAYNWATSRSAPRRATNRFGTYTRNTTKFGTPATKNTVKPLKGKFPSNTRRVTYLKGKGKRKSRAVVKIPRQITTHPHTVRQTHYLSKNTYDSVTGTIGSLIPFELNPSFNEKYLTGMVMCISKTYWGTQKINATEVAKIGNQVIPPTQSSMYLTGPNNDTSFTKRCNMFTINNLPQQPNGLIPNNHYISGFNLNIDIASLVPGAQTVTVQVVKRAMNKDPVVNGSTSTADIQEMLNDISVIDKDEFQTIYQKTMHLPALVPGKDQKIYKIKKFISCSLKRNTLRRTSSISSFSTVVGAQVKPHYEFSENGEMYNQCFLIIKAKRYNNTANVTSVKTGNGSGADGTSNLPLNWDEMTPARCRLSGADVYGVITYGGYPEPMIKTTGNTGIFSGACVRIRGFISTYYRVKELKNVDTENTVSALRSTAWPKENLLDLNENDESPEKSSENSVSEKSVTDEEPDFIPNPNKNK